MGSAVGIEFWPTTGVRQPTNEVSPSTGLEKSPTAGGDHWSVDRTRDTSRRPTSPPFRPAYSHSREMVDSKEPSNSQAPAPPIPMWAGNWGVEPKSESQFGLEENPKLSSQNERPGGETGHEHLDVLDSARQVRGTTDVGNPPRPRKGCARATRGRAT